MIVWQLVLPVKVKIYKNQYRQQPSFTGRADIWFELAKRSVKAVWSE